MDGRAAAGVGPIMQEGQPAAWTVYLASDDVDATAKLIGEHGGSIFAGPMDIPDNGRMLIAADPTGGVFGVWQQTGMIGSMVVDEPGAFVWDDARLHDVEAGKRFYADVFGFTYAPLGPEAGEGPADYETFSVGDRPAGGIGGMMGAPSGTPSHWLPYFMVADADAAAEAVGDGGRNGVDGAGDHAVRAHRGDDRSVRRGVRAAQPAAGALSPARGPSAEDRCDDPRLRVG